MGASEADILASTYIDTCTIYRSTVEKLPSGESVQRSGVQGAVIAENVKCALSTHSGGKYKQSPSTASAATDYLVFFRPEVDVQAGDTLLLTHLGKTKVYTCGRPDRQVSHSAVPAKPEKETV